MLPILTSNSAHSKLYGEPFLAEERGESWFHLLYKNYGANGSKQNFLVDCTRVESDILNFFLLGILPGLKRFKLQT